MTTESDFQAKLDANPEDWQTRLVLADFLDEQGDERAEGYRSLGMLKRFPVEWEAANWSYHNGKGYNISKPRRKRYPRKHALPQDWVEKIIGFKGGSWAHASGRFLTRREAEDAAALAFAKLPLARRAQLLAMEVTK